MVEFFAKYNFSLRVNRDKTRILILLSYIYSLFHYVCVHNPNKS